MLQSLFLLGLVSGVASKVDVVGYYGNSGNAVPYIPLFRNINANYNIVIITFANFDRNGALTLDIQGPYAKNFTGLASDIQAWKAGSDKYGRRRAVLVSIGGQNGNWPGGLTPAQIQTGLTNFINQFHLDGFDIDLEAGAIGGASTMLSVIQSFVSSGKIVTAAPEASQGPLNAYQKILSALTWVHPQFYNNPPNGVTDPWLPPSSLWPTPWTVSDWQAQEPKNSSAFWAGVLGAIGTHTSLKATQLGMLIPATPNAAGSQNHWDIALLQKQARAAGVRAVGCWAIAYDNSNGWKFAEAMGALNA
jgi:chitinase